MLVLIPNIVLHPSLEGFFFALFAILNIELQTVIHYYTLLFLIVNYFMNLLDNTFMQVYYVTTN